MIYQNEGQVEMLRRDRLDLDTNEGREPNFSEQQSKGETRGVSTDIHIANTVKHKANSQTSGMNVSNIKSASQQSETLI